MSYGRRPYYILGSDNRIEFYGDERIDQGSKLQGVIDNAALGQFLVSLLQDPREFIHFIKQGLVCNRYTHNTHRKEGHTDPGERARRKVDVLENLEEAVTLLQKEIDKAHKRGIKKDPKEEDTTSFAKRWRGTLEEARLAASKGNMTSHILDNQDGTYSIMSHLVCEWCDYCEEFDIDIHIAKANPYENQEKD